jgi:hypothetical protein
MPNCRQTQSYRQTQICRQTPSYRQTQSYHQTPSCRQLQEWSRHCLALHLRSSCRR